MTCSYWSLLTLLLSVVFFNSGAQCATTCINNEGIAVDWWVVLKVPGKLGKTGFGYYDSQTTVAKMGLRTNPPDQQNTALWRTLEQINTAGLQVVAWNDENPNGTTSSSLAHSKTVIAVSQTEKMGFIMVHSIPKYPAFSGNKVNQTIASSELIYGQHVLCMTVSHANLEIMAAKLLVIHPYIYQATIGSWSPNLYRLSQMNFGNSTNTFENYALVLGAVTNVRTIYKNNVVNSSIFEDGLNNYLKSPLHAETWGRPLQVPWCTKPYPVLNVKSVNLGVGYVWPETDDHSKWAVADNGYSCFGDMNRMSSQWKRGGAFYCLHSESLLAAIKSIVTSADICS